MKYSADDLERLHSVLYEILEEINRVCEKFDIHYFLIGGSAIGLYYDSAILPWDDDLDIGMTRENYNRFLEIAPYELKSDYFLSCVDTDIHTPFFYAKVKRNHTLFVEENYKDVLMHQGIFVDVFPYDRIPNNMLLREAQYRLANFLKCCLMGKEVWLWGNCGKCQIERPLQRSRTSCLINKLLNLFLSKRNIFRLNVFVQTLFNGCKTQYYNLVVAKVNYVESIDINSIIPVNFGPIRAYALKTWKKNLHLNYPNLHRHEGDEQINHAPIMLSFNNRS